jgi:cardiolipin synthase A/B
MQAIRNLRQHEIGAAVTSWVSSRAVFADASMQEQSAPYSVVRNVVIYRAALVLRDNFRNRKRIERAYLKAIGEAHHEIIIANAYFLPGGKLRHATNTSCNTTLHDPRVQCLAGCRRGDS